MTERKKCEICGNELEIGERAWKCCPIHTTQNGDDIVCGSCVKELHPDTHDSFDLENTTHRKTIPLTIDTPEGKKTIGTCTVSEDGETISITNVDPEYAHLIQDRVHQFSINHPDEPVRHNIFEDKEKS